MYNGKSLNEKLILSIVTLNLDVKIWKVLIFPMKNHDSVNVTIIWNNLNQLIYHNQYS